MVEHQEGFTKGIRDANIYYQFWLPEGEPKATLLIVHGLGEHSGRYMNVVNHFVPLGYAVYGLDHLGHGRSDGTRMYVRRFSDYTDTLETYFHMVRDWQPRAPIFLVGHSMGGLIGAYYLCAADGGDQHQAELKGAVLSGPAVKVPETVTPITILMAKVLSALTPKASLPTEIDPRAVSRDTEVVEAYVNDPLVDTGSPSARLGAEMLKAQQCVMSEAHRISLPILIVQGGDDKLVPPMGARTLYEAIRATDKTLKVYDGLYHEVFNEPERAQVLSDVGVWLEAHF